MADTPETPTTPAAAKPTTRRRAPRKAAAVKPTSAPKPPLKPQVKPAPEAAKPAVAPSVAAAKTAPVKAIKPRSPKRATRATPAPRKPATKSAVAKATDKVGGKWSAAAIAGGVAAVGAAAVGALLTLRGSTPKDAKPQKPKGKGAHQADGTDSSKSFSAGIADEGTIPE